MVEIDGTDPTLRPSMTTSNKIITSGRRCVFIFRWSHCTARAIPFMCSNKDGMNVVKQEVQIRWVKQNSNDAVIKLGLVAGDKVYLSVPPVKMARR